MTCDLWKVRVRARLSDLTIIPAEGARVQQHTHGSVRKVMFSRLPHEGRISAAYGPDEGRTMAMTPLLSALKLEARRAVGNPPFSHEALSKNELVYEAHFDCIYDEYINV